MTCRPSKYPSLLLSNISLKHLGHWVNLLLCGIFSFSLFSHNCSLFAIDFGVLAQKCLKLCANGVLKFQFFFLNLSSKVLAGVTVRTSKYPYMNICVLGSWTPTRNFCQKSASFFKSAPNNLDSG